MMTVEQIVNVQKSNVETLFGLTGTAFEGIEKLVELNLQVAKSAMADAAANAKAVLSVKDAQELLALQSSLLQPAAEKAAAYSRYVYEIAASTGAEVHVDRRHGRQERARRHRERRRAGQVGCRRREQRVRERAEGHQASRRSRRCELPSDVVDGRSRHEDQARCLSVELKRACVARAALRERPGFVRAFFCAVATAEG